MLKEAIISALIGLAAEGALSKAKERTLQFLKEKGFDVPPRNFSFR